MDVQGKIKIKFKKEIIMDIFVGEEYDHLTVLEFSGVVMKGGTQRYIFKCECDCGNIVEKTDVLLRNSNLSHCGCKINRNREGLKGCSNYWGRAQDIGYESWRRLLRKRREKGVKLADEVLDFELFQKNYLENIHNKGVTAFEKVPVIYLKNIICSNTKVVNVRSGETSLGVKILEVINNTHIKYECRFCKSPVTVTLGHFRYKKKTQVCTCHKKSAFIGCKNYKDVDKNKAIFLNKWLDTYKV